MTSTGSEKRPAEELYMGLDLSTQQVHWGNKNHTYSRVLGWYMQSPCGD